MENKENNENISSREAFCKFFSCPVQKQSTKTKKNNEKCSSYHIKKPNDKKFASSHTQYGNSTNKHYKNKSAFVLSKTDEKFTSNQNTYKIEDERDGFFHQYSKSTGYKKFQYGQQLCWTDCGKISISNSMKAKMREGQGQKGIKKISKAKFLTDLKHKRTQTMENFFEEELLLQRMKRRK